MICGICAVKQETVVDNFNVLFVPL